MILLNEEVSGPAVSAIKEKFRPGDLVRHKRYKYRGVVVKIDPCCQADENWYLSNHTQPDKGQPWYHVLVHNSTSATYPAESSLEKDYSDEPINNPLIGMFFRSFRNGRYVRNKRHWPPFGEAD